MLLPLRCSVQKEDNLDVIVILFCKCRSKYAKKHVVFWGLLFHAEVTLRKHHCWTIDGRKDTHFLSELDVLRVNERTRDNPVVPEIFFMRK